MNVRDGEQPHTVFRTERFCQINGSWYFVTREQTQEGPYTDQDEAKVAVQDYIQRMMSDGRSAPRV